MYVLTLTLCLAAAPKNCHIENLPFAQNQGLQDCYNGAQLEAIDFLRAHPEMILAGWTCELPKT
jgi:hypothetical protein